MVATATNEPQLAVGFQDRVAYLHELAEKRPDQVRRWLETHPRNLMVYLGWEPQPFHDEGFEHYLQHRKALWLAPRGSGKSTVAVILAAWLGFARPEHWAPYLRTLFDGAPRRIAPDNIRLALTSNSHPKAVALLWQVKSILTGKALSRLYGPLAGTRWRDDFADTRLRRSNLREATYTALGLGSKVTGGHYDFVLADDWVTLENARTNLQRSRIEDFWAFTVKGTCEPWARVAVAGTRYHPKDWYGVIRNWSQTDGMDWHVLRHPAVLHRDDGGRVSYWPQAYTLEYLDATRDEIGSIAFATQYQNEVDVMLGDFFEAAWLENHRIWDERPERERDAAITGIALDPAFKGNERADWSVFSICHYVRATQEWHFEALRRGRWTKEQHIQQAEDLWRELKSRSHEPRVLGVEKIGGTEWLIQDLKKSKVIPSKAVRGLPPRVDKIGRADKVRSYFERGKVWFDPPTGGNQIQLGLDELIAFTGERGGQDDCVDSMVWNMIALSRGSSRLRKRTRRPRTIKRRH